MASRHPRRRGVCRSRLCTLVVLSSCLWVVYLKLAPGDYSVFESLDPDTDPVYLPRSRYHNTKDANGTNINNFPVIPAGLVKASRTSSPAVPLSESDVIPNGVEFVRHLKQALTSYGDRDIIVSLVDYGFVEVALNFLRTSIEPLDLKERLLLVCLDTRVASTLSEFGYKCLLLDLASAGSEVAADFGSQDYYRKTNVKTWIVLQLLRLGRTVLISDVDLVIFRDPFAHFRCAACDLHLQMDRQLYNSGFVYIRATAGAMAVYERAWRYYLHYHVGHDQAYVNMAIRELTRNRSLQVEELPSSSFPCGVYYFENGRRQFYNRPPCPDCVIVHNNYMGTAAGKIYRFKENLLWRVDADGYYSSTEARYITYDNPLDFGAATLEVEQLALLNAFVVASLTNRLLILPSFRCCNCRTKSCDHPRNRCSLLTSFKLKSFDEVFAGKYREHSFLRSDLVPDSIKNGISPMIFLNTTMSSSADISQYVYEHDDVKELEKDIKTFDFRHKKLDKSALLAVVGGFSSFPVLRFHSLYGPFDFDDVTDSDGVPLLENFRLGIQCGVYEQWEVSLEEKIFGKS